MQYLYINLSLSRVIAVGCLTLGLLSLFGQPASAANLTIAPTNESYKTGQTFIATIMVDPEGDAVLSASGDIVFDTEKLAVIDISNADSDFSSWSIEPTLTDSGGAINFAGRSLVPLMEPAAVFTIKFTTLSPGVAWLNVNNISITNSDGEKVNQFVRIIKVNYATITSGTVPATGSVVPPVLGTPTDDYLASAPRIISPDFTDPNQWYNRVEGSLVWQLPPDVVKVATDITTDFDHEPLTVHSPPITELNLARQDLIDGVQYVSVQFKDQQGWGKISNRVIKIDTIAPEPFTIMESNDGSQIRLSFTAYDALSGIKQYEIMVADRAPVWLTQTEARSGYLLKGLTDGAYLVAVIARDFAGNERVSTKPVLVAASKTKKLSLQQEPAPQPAKVWQDVLIIILVLIILTQLTVFYYGRRCWQEKAVKLNRDNKAVYKRVRIIFSSLQDEVHDQIITLTKRPRLSKKEKAAVDSLHAALEVSETLIKKEIDGAERAAD